jgi:hypothetical protein
VASVTKLSAGAGIIAGNIPLVHASLIPRDPLVTSTKPTCQLDRSELMKYLGYAYRFLSNFVFLAMVYYSLNFLDKYQQRAVAAALILAFAAMRAVSALRSFYFFQKIERLENETRRLASHIAGGPGDEVARKMIVNEVAELRRGGEVVSYIDLLFLTLIILLCVSKIVTN